MPANQNLVQMKFKPTDTERLILLNQAVIMQALSVAISHPQIRMAVDKAVENVHNYLGIK